MKRQVPDDSGTPAWRHEALPSRRRRYRHAAFSICPLALVLALLCPAALPQTQNAWDLSCLVNNEGVLPASCFRWVSVIIDDQKQFDSDRISRKQLREEYVRSYEELSGAKKKRVRKECSAHADEALRGFCFGYWTCTEAGKPLCESVKKVYSAYWDCTKDGNTECESVKNSYKILAASDEHACHGVLALRKGGDSLNILLDMSKDDKGNFDLQNEYERAYEGLDEQIKERISNKCCGKEDSGIRVLCFLYDTCSEVELSWCRELHNAVPDVFSGSSQDPAIIKEKISRALEKMNTYASPISDGSGRHTPAKEKKWNWRGRGLPPPPCLDLNPNCPSWARDGECSYSPDYMNSNCPLSCDQCNRALTSLHHGVEQKRDFPDLILTDGMVAVKTSYTDKGELKEPTKRKRTSTYLDTRVREVLVAMEAYLDSEMIKGAVISQTCNNRHTHCALWAARGLCDVKRPTMKEVCPAVCHACERLPIMIDQDDTSSYGPSRWPTAFERMDLLGIFEAIEEDRLILHANFEMKGPKAPELVKLIQRENVDNIPLRQFGFMVYRLEPSKEALARVRQRRRWAQRGILPSTLLEEQRRKVKKIGREIVSIKKRKDRNTIESEQMMAEANELAERMERKVGVGERDVIAKEREEILSNLKVLQKQSSVLANEMQEVLESQRLLLKQSLENQSQLKKEASTESGNNGSASEGWGKGYADGPIIARFDKFLTPKECQELLSLVRGDKKTLVNTVTNQIVPNSEPIDEDGFSKASMEMIVEGGMARPVRISSRIFVDPTSSVHHKEGQRQYQFGQNIVNPVVQRLLSKIEMITSVPGDAHVEVPILFERFGKGDFEGPKPHFGDVPSLPVTSGPGTKRDDVGNASHPMAMKNARILKMIIFLSDVEDGGEIVFPGMGNFAIEPLAGRALLVPSVLTLVGEREDEVGLSLVDDPFIGSEPKGDVTCLVEDMDTISEHRRVEEGVKYVLTVWLRRYPIR